MAGIGVRYPYVAKYEYDETAGTVSYLDALRLAMAVEFSAEIETADDNELRADDVVAESDVSFAGGKLAITTDDLETEPALLILGVDSDKVTIGGEEAVELKFNENTEAPDLGFGIIITKKKKGVNLYRAIVLHKVKFEVPNDGAKTKGKQIEWQTPELSATIMKDDTEDGGWKSEATFKSFANAHLYVKKMLGLAA